jgi:hypothetical protein
MRKSIWILMAMAMLTVMQHASAAEPNIKRGMMFLDARKVILKSGWAGIIIHKSASEDSDAQDYLDEQARPYYKLGVHEVDSCAGGSHPTCLFHYRKKDECLTVVTYGETPHDSFVTHWMNTCGD